MAAGTYEYAGRISDVSPVGMMQVSATGTGCIANGRFQVHEVAFDAAGALTRLAVDFEQHCSDAKPGMRDGIPCCPWRPPPSPQGGHALTSRVAGFVLSHARSLGSAARVGETIPHLSLR